MAIIEISRDRSTVRLAANLNGRADRDGVTPVKLKGWRRKLSHGPVHFFGYCHLDILNTDHGNGKCFLAMELTKKKKVNTPVRVERCNTRREAKEKATSWLCESQGLLVQPPDLPGAIGAAGQASMLVQLNGTTRRASWCVPVQILSPEVQDGKVEKNSRSNVAVEPAQLPAQNALVTEATPEPVPAVAGDTLRGEGELKGGELVPQSGNERLLSRLFGVVRLSARAAWNSMVQRFLPSRRKAVAVSK